MKIPETPEVRNAIARRATCIRYGKTDEAREWGARLARARAEMLRSEADRQFAIAVSLESAHISDAP